MPRGAGSATPSRRSCTASRCAWTSSGTCCAAAARMRAAGQDPGSAELRDEDTVEHYQQ